MASDDIEKLLAEIDATTPGRSPAPKPEPASREVAKPGRDGGRVAFAAAAAVVLGIATWAFGLVMPFMGAVETGIGGAIGGFVAALVAGPPRWFSR